MSLIASKQADRDLIPEGLHSAICYSVYDIGHQKSEMYNKWQHQCIIAWEFPLIRIEYEKNGQKLEGPRVLSKFYTVTLDERGNLKKDLVNWRGKSFTDEELDGFDLKNVVGVACQIQIIHEKKPNGKVRESMNFSPALKTDEKPVAHNPLVYYDLDAHLEDEGPPEGMPDFIVKLIQKSREVAGDPGIDAGNKDFEAGRGANQLTDEEASNTGGAGEEDDDCPF
jgi:hypothetical protein